MRGKGHNQQGFDRKRTKQAERRRPHTDKYADRPRIGMANEERTNERS